MSVRTTLIYSSYHLVSSSTAIYVSHCSADRSTAAYRPGQVDITFAFDHASGDVIDVDKRGDLEKLSGRIGSPADS